MASTKRWAGTSLAGALLAAAAWAQSDKPLDLRLPQAGGAAGGSVCTVCGEIRSIREVHVGRAPAAQAGVPTGASPATDDWRVVGAVAYLPLGQGTNGERWRLGAVGTPEMQDQFGESSYEIMVLMDGGERRTIQRRDGSRFKLGQRVRLRGGELEAMYP
jgi:hypothetical protein